VINPQTGKPLDEKSLRRHFKREIATGEIELHARVGNFIVANILGVASPAGTVAIDNQARAPGRSRFFLPRPGCGGRPVVNRHKEHVGGPIEYEDTNVRQINLRSDRTPFQCNRPSSGD
jgi:hypothetical protein